MNLYVVKISLYLIYLFPEFAISNDFRLNTVSFEESAKQVCIDGAKARYSGFVVGAATDYEERKQRSCRGQDIAPFGMMKGPASCLDVLAEIDCGIRIQDGSLVSSNPRNWGTKREGSEADDVERILAACNRLELGIIPASTISRDEIEGLIQVCKSRIAQHENCSQLNVPGVRCIDTSPGQAAAAADSATGPCSLTNYNQLSTKAKECTESKNKADFCCNAEGLACLMGMEEGSAGAALTGVGTMLTTTLVNMKQMYGMSQNCDSQEGLANFSTGMNAAIASNCQMKVNSCKDSCTTLITEVSAAVKSCESSPNQNDRVIVGGKFKELNGKLTASNSSCQRLQGNVIAMGSQAAITQITTSQMSKMCKDMIAASPPPVAPGLPGNDLCNDISDLSNPYCRQMFCSQPGTMNAPECQQQVNPSNTGSTSGSGGRNGYTTLDAGTRLGVGADSGETPPSQLPQFGQNEIEANSVAPPGMGMPGGGMPGGAGGSGGDSGYDTGGGGQQKLNTGILQGFSGGGGYSVSGVGVSNEGGYSNPTGQGGGANPGGKPFDLGQFLPKNPPQRNLAGLAQSGKESILANKHDDIFQRVSNKYRELCIRKELWCNKDVP